MTRRLDWATDGGDWPHRAASRFVPADGFTWHVQILGDGPALLLLHGTGASSHSWRDLVPLLGGAFRLVIPDLPGHGFSERAAGRPLSLPNVAAGVAALLAALDFAPAAIVGHSAGAAVALRLVLDGAVRARSVVGLNGALAPFPGMGAWLFPAMAKLLFTNPFAAPMLARRADDPAAVARLIEGTGSRLGPDALDFYRRLLRTERHVEATLAMMANWDLRPLQRDLPRLDARLTLIAAERDRAVPPAVARAAQALVPGTYVVTVPRLGHLAHEEDPAGFAALIRTACA